MASSSLAYKRIVLKLSGEALCREGSFGVDADELSSIAARLKSVADMGVEIAIVCGGGNFLRGASFARAGVERATADHMGMLATVINALALQGALKNQGLSTRVATAISMQEIAEPYIRGRCIRHLELGKIVIIAAGTGNPFFTTDTAAALRAAELDADLLLKATKVDGVYSADPVQNPDAVLYKDLTYMDVLSRRLNVMDSTAVSLCMENHLSILVLNMKRQGTIEAALRGEKEGTLVQGD